MSCLEHTVGDPIFFVLFCAEIGLLTLHLSVLACILRQRRKGRAAFQSGFFSIYIMQSVADVFSYFLVSHRRLKTLAVRWPDLCYTNSARWLLVGGEPTTAV